MKKLMILLCCFMSLAACSSCTSKDTPPADVAPVVVEEIKWIDAGDADAESIITRSATENKIILMFFHHNKCKWCKQMANETFKDQAVVRIVNENFIPVFVDVEEHPAMVADFGIEAYPAYWFGKARMGEDGEIDSENSSRAKTQGFFEPEAYIKLLEHAIDTL